MKTLKKSLPRRLTVLDVSCPHCKAAPGSQCVNTKQFDAPYGPDYQHQAREHYLAGYRAGAVDAITDAVDALRDLDLPTREKRARR